MIQAAVGCIKAGHKKKQKIVCEKKMALVYYLLAQKLRVVRYKSDKKGFASAFRRT